MNETFVLMIRQVIESLAVQPPHCVLQAPSIQHWLDSGDEMERKSATPIIHKHRLLKTHAWYSQLVVGREGARR
ncbi:hypothetical protein BDV93DRAFT_320767 [Ceratobasidium sp. AG-I]|nr:hypothetical protein BDV93DRAFT_320767 [Ceratobasidium sp. AG-I]